jgi:hypothetical protein
MGIFNMGIYIPSRVLPKSCQSLQVINLFQSFLHRKLTHDPINRIGAWGYFDGVGEGTSLYYGAGGIIFFDESHSINF